MSTASQRGFAAAFSLASCLTAMRASQHDTCTGYENKKAPHLRGLIVHPLSAPPPARRLHGYWVVNDGVADGARTHDGGITMLSIARRDESFAAGNPRRVRVFFCLALVAT